MVHMKCAVKLVCGSVAFCYKSLYVTSLGLFCPGSHLAPSTCVFIHLLLALTQRRVTEVKCVQYGTRATQAHDAQHPIEKCFKTCFRHVLLPLKFFTYFQARNTTRFSAVLASGTAQRWLTLAVCATEACLSSVLETQGQPQWMILLAVFQRYIHIRRSWKMPVAQRNWSCPATSCNEFISSFISGSDPKSHNLSIIFHRVQQIYVAYTPMFTLAGWNVLPLSVSMNVSI